MRTHGAKMRATTGLSGFDASDMGMPWGAAREIVKASLTLPSPGGRGFSLLLKGLTQAIPSAVCIVLLWAIATLSPRERAG